MTVDELFSLVDRLSNLGWVESCPSDDGHGNSVWHYHKKNWYCRIHLGYNSVIFERVR